MTVIEKLLTEIDNHLKPMNNGDRLELYLVGRSALNAQFGKSLVTVDLDVVVTGTPPALLEAALAFAGKGSDVAEDIGLYLEMLPSALPPMPSGYRNRVTEMGGSWTVLRVWHLDVHDLLISKLGRFAVKDQQDIRELCDTGTIDIDKLKLYHKSAVWTLNHPGTSEYAERQAKLDIVLRYLNEGVWSGM